MTHILVLQALKQDDPVRRALEIAFEVMEPEWKNKLQFTFCEVGSENDLVDALNGFDGNIAIFDGHGGHKQNESGLLYLKELGVNVWNLKDRITRVPPIVLLSACDTHAADRNHATTGNGFLALGARSVLASVFPLDARDAAVFLGRLLLRVANYVPIAPGVLRRPIRWDEVVHGMLQMQLMTDFLRYLHSIGTINEKTMLQMHYKGNNAINGGDTPPEPDPFQFILGCLATLGHDPDHLKLSLQSAIANSSVISYVQLGRPETILIRDEKLVNALTKLTESEK